MERLELILKTISDEFYIETSLSAYDVCLQRRFQHFQALLIFLKLSSKEETSSQPCTHYFTDDFKDHWSSITSIIQAEEVERKSGSSSSGPVNISQVKLCDNVKESLRSTEAVEKRGDVKLVSRTVNKAHRNSHNRDKENLVQESSDGVFCPPRWSQMLIQELHNRSSQELSNESCMENVYHRDSERVTKYDEEIAKVFDEDDHVFTTEPLTETKVTVYKDSVDVTKIIRAQSRTPSAK